MRSSYTRWLLFLAFVVFAGGLAVVATKEAEGECSANDESCAADNGRIELEEELTECKDTNEECEHWASLGEVRQKQCDANPNYMQ
eukprot:scaffold13389_cov126-Skeletonema_dohrnii-CCMP3373.AAC.1